MREGIGSVFLYNIIIVFILIVFAFLAATMSYAKAFKVNTIIVNAIERYEGYNNLAIEEIRRGLGTIGYRYDANSTPKCPDRDGVKAMVATNIYNRYCVYQSLSNNYYTYGVVTYISIDIPIIGDFIQVPIYTKTSRLYKFS